MDYWDRTEKCDKLSHYAAGISLGLFTLTGYTHLSIPSLNAKKEIPIYYNRVIADSLIDNIMAFDKTADGGFVFIGNKNISEYSYDILLLKTDSSGEKQWEKT